MEGLQPNLRKLRDGIGRAVTPGIFVYLVGKGLNPAVNDLRAKRR